MKDISGKIHYKGNDYRLVFNLNVMERLQEEYGSVDKWAELTDSTEPNVKAIKFGFREMLNEGIEIDNEENGTDTPLLTLKQVGRLISEVGFDQVSLVMNDTVINSTENPEKNA